MYQVSLQSCLSYDEYEVYKAIIKALDSLGGISKYVHKKQKVLLKPNLLLGKSPDKGVTTHPSIVKAVARIVEEAGGQVFIGDSPGVGSTSRVARICGLDELIEENGYKLLDFSGKKEYTVEEGKIVKNIVLTDALEQADVLINLPKFKSHGYTSLTGAVKNLYGLVPGIEKSNFHFKMPDINNFVNLLLDINLIAKPALNIMDGIVSMEGNGPQNGDLVKMNLIMASDNTMAMDVVMAIIANQDPLGIPLIHQAAKRKIKPVILENIEIKGELLEDFVQEEFIVPRANVHISKEILPPFLYNFIKDKMNAKPVIDASICNACKNCKSICPAKSITVKSKKMAEIDYSKCIRCYCCQEICTQNAVKLKKSILRRMYDLV